MQLQDALDDFLRYALHEQGVTKMTYKSYHSYLYAFHRGLRENGYPAPTLADFNPAAIRRYFYAASAKGLRPRAMRATMLPLRSFGAFLVAQKVLEENPALTVKPPKKDAAIRQETTDQEISLLLEATRRQRDGKRAAFQQTVLSVFVYTGVRRAELCDLRTGNVDIAGGWLLVQQGKGQKSRKVPLCAEVQDALAAWIAIRPNAPHDFLFTADKTRRLYFNGVASLVSDVKARAGLGNRTHITPHAMRHACASRLMRNGASLFDVMTWLGHTQLSTTQRYLRASEAQIQCAAPLASLKPKEKPMPDDDKIIDLRERQQMAKSERTRRDLRRQAQEGDENYAVENSRYADA